MKKIVLLISLLMTTLAYAQEEQVPGWKRELEQYRADIQKVHIVDLYLSQGFYVGAAIGTCSLSAAITGATFVTDTLPVTNILSEGIASVINRDYQTYQKNLLEWNNLASLGRGTLGGGVVGVLEALEFVGLWLEGNDDQGFEALKKVYASSFATIDALFSDKSQCVMSISKVMITRAEINRRANVPSPLRVPHVDLVRP